MTNPKPLFTVCDATQLIAEGHSDEDRLRRMNVRLATCGEIEPEAKRMYEQIALNVLNTPRPPG